MEKDQRKITRRMYVWEIFEARRVFGHRIDYERVYIHECVDWPNWINRIGAFLKRIKYRNTPNAITLGNHCYFPVGLPLSKVKFDHSDFYKIPWLIHELTHVWQYQQMGWRYLIIALKTQMNAGRSAYEFGGETGLEESFLSGTAFRNFNLEQQGDIARSYYERICKGKDVRAWDPFINEIRADDKVDLV